MQIWPRSFDRIYNYVIIHYVKSIFYFISFFPIKNSENLNDKFIDLLSIRFVLLNCTPQWLKIFISCNNWTSFVNLSPFYIIILIEYSQPDGMDGQCQLYITNENPNENRDKYSRIIDKYSSISYVRQLRDNSLRVQTNSNYYKSQEERGGKNQPYLLFFLYTYIVFFLSFPPQKLIKQTHATYVYPHLIHDCRNVSSSGRRKQWKYFAVSIPSIYISCKYIVVSSAYAIVMNLDTLFPFLLSG